MRIAYTYFSFYWVSNDYTRYNFKSFEIKMFVSNILVKYAFFESSNGSSYSQEMYELIDFFGKLFIKLLEFSHTCNIRVIIT